MKPVAKRRLLDDLSLPIPFEVIYVIWNLLQCKLLLVQVID